MQQSCGRRHLTVAIGGGAGGSGSADPHFLKRGRGYTPTPLFLADLKLHQLLGASPQAPRIQPLALMNEKFVEQIPNLAT